MAAASFRKSHGHFWLIALLGVAAGLVLLIWAPSQPAISGSLFLFAGFHALGGVVTLVSLWQLAPGRGRAKGGLDFGASGRGPAMLLTLALAALGLAALVQALHPALWPLAFVLVAQGVTFASGHFTLKATQHLDAAPLPLCALPTGPDQAGLVIGCGAGRATVALGREWRAGPLVAMDRLAPAERARLERNLEISGLAGRVTLTEGDAVRAPFDDRAFALIVATHVYDHMRGREREALKEARRLLAHDGRLLMTLWTPGWAAFSVVSLAAFTFRGTGSWRRLLAQEGFAIEREFHIGSGWGVVVRSE